VAQSLLEAHARGLERARVFAGRITVLDLVPLGAIDNYLADLLGGYLRRMACRLRPYERTPGATDRAVASGLERLRLAFLHGEPKRAVVEEVVARFAAIEVSRRDRPKVAIFGDLYTRDNDVANQGLERFIEAHGGEVLSTPYSEYCKLIADSYFRRWLREGLVLDAAAASALMAVARRRERPLLRAIERMLGPLGPGELAAPVAELLAPFDVTNHHTGESFDNLLKLQHLLRLHPDLSLFVQANPAFCCPSLVTEAMARRIEEHTGVPVVTVTYDGTACSKNEAVIPYLTWPRRPRAR
jgi:predicted nucleotide-binding protein (sugar kinase/HSP70/actin superfamily)